MWAGAKIAHDSLRDSADKDRLKERILMRMLDPLFGNYQERYFLPSERDRRYIEIVFGKDFQDCDLRSLEAWILDIN